MVPSQRGRNDVIVRGLVAYAVAIGAAAAWFAFYQFPKSSIEEAQKPSGRSDPDSKYAGVILIPGGTDGRCRKVNFDNVTGTLREEGNAACSSPTSGANSTEGRMNAIRDAFSKR